MWVLCSNNFSNMLKVKYITLTLLFLHIFSDLNCFIMLTENLHTWLHVFTELFMQIRYQYVFLECFNLLISFDTVSQNRDFCYKEPTECIESWYALKRWQLSCNILFLYNEHYWTMLHSLSNTNIVVLFVIKRLTQFIQVILKKWLFWHKNKIDVVKLKVRMHSFTLIVHHYSYSLNNVI